MANDIIVIVERSAPRDDEVHSGAEISIAVHRGLAAHYPKSVAVTSAIASAVRDSDLESRIVNLLGQAVGQVARHKLFLCAYIGAYPILVTEGITREAVVVAIGGQGGALYLDAVFESPQGNSFYQLYQAALEGMRARHIVSAQAEQEEAKRLAEAVLSVFKKATQQK